MLRGSAQTATLLLACCAALLAGGCGSGNRATPVGLQLQREDLALATRKLTSVEQAVEREAQAAKAAWPLIVAGLPPAGDTAAHTRIHQAAELASALPIPPLFQEEPARRLTGPAAQLAGSYGTFYRLASRGWRLIDYSFAELSQGPASAGSFARANVALYIESVYDAQYLLARIGKQLASGYERLGGPQALGPALTQAEVNQLADVYSEPAFQLQPHVIARLGS